MSYSCPASPLCPLFPCLPSNLPSGGLLTWQYLQPPPALQPLGEAKAPAARFEGLRINRTQGGQGKPFSLCNTVISLIKPHNLRPSSRWPTTIDEPRPPPRDFMKGYLLGIVRATLAGRGTPYKTWLFGFLTLKSVLWRLYYFKRILEFSWDEHLRVWT